MTTPLMLYKTQLLRYQKQLSLLNHKRRHLAFKIQVTEANIRRLSRKNPGVAS